MRRRVVHVGGDPDHVADVVVANEGEQFGDLQLPPGRGAVAQRDGFRTAAVGVVVVDDQPERHVRGDHLPGGGGIQQRLLQPGELCAAENAELRAQRGRLVVGVGPAIAAQVDAEHFQQRAVGETIEDPFRVQGMAAHRQVFLEGAHAARRQQGHGSFAVAGVAVQAHLPVPVVGDLVVVPLGEHGHLGIEASQRLVHQVVAVLAAELVQGLGHLGLGGGGQVAPYAAVGQRHLGGDRAVRVDRVAGVDEEVGANAAHGVVDAHAAELRIDPPTLTGGIAAPDEAHVAASARRGDEAAAQRLAQGAVVGEIEAAHLDEDALICRQAGEIELAGVVPVVEQQHGWGGDGVGQRLARGPAHQHLRGPVGSAPDHRAITADIADLQPERHLRAAGWRPAAGGRAERRGGQRAHRCAATGELQPGAPGQWWRSGCHYVAL
jgi:hypothetical protein